MKNILFIIVLLHQATFSQRAYWQQQADYVIDVTLDDTAHALDAFMQLHYVNNSPDTLHFIWFHIWPNAYKNDQTAFSEQMLQLGKKEFYFSDISHRGYINRLDFRSDNTSMQVEDHPNYIDVIKVLLNDPLPPGTSVDISTSFHVKLPNNFSRGGHTGQSYQVTQWYPKPAVYDREGWHIMPYLHQGEYYSEFGTYDVRISLPANYKVAATGVLQDENEISWLKQQTAAPARVMPTKKISTSGKKTVVTDFPPSSSLLKTLRYKQDHAPDFAWFADKRFLVQHDTVVLPSGKQVNVFAFYPPSKQTSLQQGIDVIKKTILFRSRVLGDYPYSAMSVVLADMGFEGGMEYPMVTCITSGPDDQLETVIEHETGHNWFQAALASNERKYPWMDEGMNSYYGNRYNEEYKQNPSKSRSPMIPDKPEWLLVDALAQQKKDQPVNTSSEAFTGTNYGLIAYIKAAAWMESMEKIMGRSNFDSAMRTYYAEWKFRHPRPTDFKNVMEKIHGGNLDSLFRLLDETGPILSPSPSRRIKPAFVFGAKDYNRFHYISFLPVIGYNKYDKAMIGLGIHNYNLPFSKFQFYVAPMYGFGSNSLNGLARIGYHWFPSGKIEKISVGLGAMTYSKREGRDTLQGKEFENFYRATPSIKFHFRKPLQSPVVRTLELKSYLVGEKDFSAFSRKGSDSLDENLYVGNTTTDFYYVNQVTFRNESFRTLYPYDYELQLQQGKGFYRVNVNANYFFNYGVHGGLSLRFFAAKFGYLGNGKESVSSRFHPRLMGTTGEDDYTYGNYFAGRTATVARENEPVSNEGFAAQQIMIRDGGLKMRLDYFDFLQGRSENWVTAINLSSTLPEKLFPIRLPLHLFFDAGTYAEAWEENSDEIRFLYVGGVKLSLLKGIFNLYAPLVYNSEIRDNLQSFPDLNTFWKRMTFSIDIQKFSIRKISNNQVPL